MDQIEADLEYQNLITEARKKYYFVEVSLHDSYFRNLS